MTRKERYQKVLEYFTKHRPVAETELEYTNPYELLVAVILSAQCTDKRVNITMPALVEAFPTVEVMAEAKPEEIFPYIKSISYPNNKAKHLAAMARMLVKDFNGIVPDNINDLMKLPGVGRKTANVVASVIYDVPAIPVDTHVFRVSARLGLTKDAKNPYQTEMQLLKFIPEEKLGIAHHWLILHGRYTCVARNPKCGECGLRPYCEYYNKVVVKSGSRPRQ
jgi:endonuclease III